MSSRKQLTLEQKIAIISRLANGEKNSVIANKFSASRSTISTIWKNREAIKDEVQSSPLGKMRLRTSQYKELEDALLLWFKQSHSAAHLIPLNGPVLQAKADIFAKKLHFENFECSSSWIQRFKQRHNISFKLISGEAGAI